MHAPPSWKVEPVGGCPASIIRTLPASAAVGSGTFWTTHLLSVKVDMICGQYSLHPPILGTLGVWYQDQSVEFAPVLHSHLYFMAKKEDKRSVSCSLVAIKGRKGEWFLNWQFGQNLQNEGRALFLSIYLFYICTDIFLNLKWRRIWHLGCQKA